MSNRHDQDEHLAECDRAFDEMVEEMASRGHRLPGAAQTTADYLVTRADVVAFLLANLFDDGDMDPEAYRSRIRREVTDEVLTEGMTLIEAALHDETHKATMARAKSTLVRSMLQDATLRGNVLRWRYHPVAYLSAHHRGLHSCDDPPVDEKWRERLSYAVNARLGHGYAKLKPEDLEYGGDEYDGALTVRTTDDFHRGFWRRHMTNPRNAPRRIVDQVTARVAHYFNTFHGNRQRIDDLLSWARKTILMRVHDTPGFTIGAMRHDSVFFRNDPLAGESPISNMRLRVEVLALGHHLEVATHVVDMDIDGSGVVDLHPITMLIKQQVRRQAILDGRDRKSRLVVDPVIAAFLHSVPRVSRETLLDALRANQGSALARGDLSRMVPGLPKEVETLQMLEGGIVGRVRISSRVSWNGGRLSCHRTTLSESVINGLPGRRLSSVVDHPAIGHLVIREAYCTKTGSLRVMVTDPMVRLSDLD